MTTLIFNQLIKITKNKLKKLGAFGRFTLQVRARSYTYIKKHTLHVYVFSYQTQHMLMTKLGRGSC